MLLSAYFRRAPISLRGNRLGSAHWASTEEVLVGVGTELIRIDVTDTKRPVVVARYRLKQTMALEGMAVQGDHVFVTAGEDGLLVYELPPRRQ